MAYIYTPEHMYYYSQLLIYILDNLGEHSLHTILEHHPNHNATAGEVKYTTFFQDCVKSKPGTLSGLQQRKQNTRC